MNRRHFLASIPPAMLLSGCSRPGGDSGFRISVPGGAQEFALDLFGKLRKTPGNVFFSPLSISMALAMTARGAAGATLDEMAKVLYMPALGDDQTHTSYGNFITECTIAPASPELRIANAIWVRKDTRFEPGFATVAEGQYRAKIKSADFAQKEALCRDINEWVAKATRDRIKEIVTPKEIDATTVAELLNAIYFKGEWKTKFDKADTKEGTFQVTPDKTVKVPFMSLREQSFPFAERDDYSVLEMPYLGGNLAMMFVLPARKKTLDDLEKTLSPATLKEWAAATRPTKPHVVIPKFDMACSAHLAPILVELGMKTAFNERQADFSRMTKDTELYIGDVTHKAVVTVSEEGTEAAAATAVKMKERKMGDSFIADRPFLFLIRDTQTGGILFMGRVSNPVA